MKDKRKTHERVLIAQLDQWNVQISMLKAKADRSETEVKIGCYKIIAALQQKQDMARKKLHELRNTGDKEWEDLKKGAEKTWAEVRSAFKEATSKF